MQTSANKRVTSIASPLSGKVIPLSEVPDPVFSEKVLGDVRRKDLQSGRRRDLICS